MPSPTRLVRSLFDRRLPLRTRRDLLMADVRRRLAPCALYRVRLGHGCVYLTDDDYGVDRASFDFAVSEGSYATDYEGVVVLDVGAHKGYYAAYAAERGARAIVTYEPESTNLSVLERTADDYRREGTEWTVHKTAVDASTGKADIHVMRSSWGHALDPPAAFAEDEVGVESVRVTALAEALAEAGTHAGSRLVVKVNIEGAECSAILETPPAFFSEVSEIFVETHPWASCDASTLAAHLETAGFTRAQSVHHAVLRMRREEPAQSDRRSDPT